MSDINLGPYTPEGSALRRSLLVAPDDLGSVHIEGASGEGKSTFMGWLMDDCAAAGEGIFLGDTKGDLAARYAACTRFPERLVYVAPGLLTDRCFTLNPFEFDRTHPFAERLASITADNVIRTFEHIGRADTSWMSYIRKYLSAATRLALLEPEPTLIHLIAILIDDDYRTSLLKDADANQRSFWADYVNMTPYVQQTQTESTKGRLWDFLFNPLVRHWVGSYRSSLRLMDLLTTGHIVVCNLGHNLSEFEGQIIGNLLISHLMTEYRLRESALSPFDRSRRIRVFVDEFHELSPAPFARTIEHGRGFNFFVVVANQHAAQLREHERLAEAVRQARLKVMLHGSSDKSAADLPRFKAHITWRIKETKTATLTLRDWWSPPVPGQLAAAERAMADDALTMPVADVIEMVPHVAPRPPRRAKAKRDATIDKDDHYGRAEETTNTPAPSGTDKVRSAAGQGPAAPAGGDPEGAGGLDADRPVRVPDRRSARTLALFQSADATRRPAEPRGGGAGDQSDDAAPAQGPRPGRGGPASS